MAKYLGCLRALLVEMKVSDVTVVEGGREVGGWGSDCSREGGKMQKIDSQS